MPSNYSGNTHRPTNYLSIYLSIYQKSIHLSVCLSILSSIYGNEGRDSSYCYSTTTQTVWGALNGTPTRPTNYSPSCCRNENHFQTTRRGLIETRRLPSPSIASSSITSPSIENRRLPSPSCLLSPPLPPPPWRLSLPLSSPFCLPPAVPSLPRFRPPSLPRIRPPTVKPVRAMASRTCSCRGAGVWRERDALDDGSNICLLELRIKWVQVHRLHVGGCFVGEARFRRARAEGREKARARDSREGRG